MEELRRIYIEEDINKLKTQCKKLLKYNYEMKSDITLLRREKHNLENSTIPLKAEITTIRNSLNEKQRELEEERAKSRTIQLKLNQIEREHSNDIHKLETTHSDAIHKLETTHSDAIHKLETTHNDAIHKLKKKLKNKEKGFIYRIISSPLFLMFVSMVLNFICQISVQDYIPSSTPYWIGCVFIYIQNISCYIYKQCKSQPHELTTSVQQNSRSSNQTGLAISE